MSTRDDDTFENRERRSSALAEVQTSLETAVDLAEAVGNLTLLAAKISHALDQCKADICKLRDP